MSSRRRATAPEVMRAVGLRARGWKLVDIAVAFDVSEATVSRWCRGLTRHEVTMYGAVPTRPDAGGGSRPTVGPRRDFDHDHKPGQLAPFAHWYQDPRLVALMAAAHGRTNTMADLDAFLARFERQVDPEGILAPDECARRVAHARRAYMVTLALEASRARSARAGIPHEPASAGAK